MKRILYILLITCSAAASAQDYQVSLQQHREEYKAEFLTYDRSPLKKEDLPYLSFFDGDTSLILTAQFTRTENASEFDMATYSGAVRKYIKYGDCTFYIKNLQHKLSLYQGVDLIKKPGYEDYLFLPFKDFTNGIESYGGGRYMDFKTGDIKNGILLIDFNKAYNPYCAYSDGYSCPIPPEENHLQIEIRAGEKKFGRDH
jgi:uncharacterized protein